MHAKRWVANGPTVSDFELVDVEIPDPGPGEVTIEVRAAGLNPIDFKSPARVPDPSMYPVPVGFEVAGVVTAAGEGAGFEVGDEVIAFRVTGGYSSALTVPAADVFAKPATLGFPAAANLLLAGATAADMLRVADVKAGETILVHGASGAVGVSVLQQAALLGARVIGTASAANAAVVERFGGVATTYGDGLADRVRALAPEGIAAALDCVGTDEAADVSLELVDRSRIITIAGYARAERDGFILLPANSPDSPAFRDSIRSRLVELAAEGKLEVPVARTFPLDQAVAALELLQTGHPGGKLALVP